MFKVPGRSAVTASSSGESSELPYCAAGSSDLVEHQPELLISLPRGSPDPPFSNTCLATVRDALHAENAVTHAEGKHLGAVPGSSGALVTREMCFLPPNEWDPLSFLVLGRPQTLMLTVLGGAGRVRERVDPRPHNGRGRAKSGDALGPRLLPNDTSREMPYRLVPEQNRVQ